MYKKKTAYLVKHFSYKISGDNHKYDNSCPFRRSAQHTDLISEHFNRQFLLLYENLYEHIKLRLCFAASACSNPLLYELSFKLIAIVMFIIVSFHSTISFGVSSIRLFTFTATIPHFQKFVIKLVV
ncbi:MAG: hypothetical protein K2I96_18985 [Lachnospiraceae bacterium]|nr:hypothetical protein [Lachnospiraceae bacterium]